MKKTAKTKKSAVKLLDFTASWCGPCQAMKPILRKFEAAHPEMKVVCIDIDRSRRKADTYDIRCVPTFVVERDGEVVARAEGMRPLVALERLVAGRR